VYGSINLTLDFIGLDERFVNEGMQATPMDIAFLIATHSYCSRFGGRDSPDPDETLEELPLMPKAKKKAMKKKAKKSKKKK